MKPQILNEKIKTAGAKLKGGLENQKSVVQMHLLRRKLHFIHNPEDLGYFIDADKDKADNKFYNHNPHRRRKLGAMAVIGSVAVVGSGLWMRNQIHHKPVTTTPGPAALPPHFSTMDSLPTNKIQSITCVGMGPPRPISINVPKDKIINYQLLSQAVQDSFTTPSNCPPAELDALLSSENQLTSPGFEPEPNFDASTIQQDQAGNFIVIGPQSARLEN